MNIFVCRLLVRFACQSPPPLWVFLTLLENQRGLPISIWPMLLRCQDRSREIGNTHDYAMISLLKNSIFKDFQTFQQTSKYFKTLKLFNFFQNWPTDASMQKCCACLLRFQCHIQTFLTPKEQNYAPPPLKKTNYFSLTPTAPTRHKKIFHAGPFGTIGDHAQPYGTIRDHTGP